MGFLNGTIIGVAVLVLSFICIRFYSTNISQEPVIIVGGGLAGLSAAIEAHNNGVNKIILIEKESRLGGNSAKASSGINAVGTTTQRMIYSQDSISTFINDTMNSGGGACNKELVELIANESSSAISFLLSLGVDLSVLSKCGGHSYARTHRSAPPSPGQPPRNIGFSITSKLIDHINKTQSIQVITGARVQKLIKEGEKVVGVEYQDIKSNSIVKLRGGAVILTTGGFGADRKPGGLLEKYGGEELANLPTTNGPWATGDGMKLAEEVGAKMVLMDQVQIHPTGFVDPKDPTSPTKFLAPEALRAVGGILINKEGKRFVDELSLRNQVAPAIFTNGFKIGDDKKQFTAAYMLLNDEAVNTFGAASLSFYMGKGFIVNYANIDEFTAAVGVDKTTLEQTLTTYNEKASEGGPDEFGKTTFPVRFDSSSPVNVLIVTPSIHYTMGGAFITTEAKVVNSNNNAIPGLYAAGEASGGVHGNNRLAGNSLLECVVFGRIAGTQAAMYTK